MKAIINAATLGTFGEAEKIVRAIDEAIRIRTEEMNGATM